MVNQQMESSDGFITVQKKQQSRKDDNNSKNQQHKKQQVKNQKNKPSPSDKKLQPGLLRIPKNKINNTSKNTTNPKSHAIKGAFEIYIFINIVKVRCWIVVSFDLEIY